MQANGIQWIFSGLWSQKPTQHLIRLNCARRQEPRKLVTLQARCATHWPLSLKADAFTAMHDQPNRIAEKRKETISDFQTSLYSEGPIQTLVINLYSGMEAGHSIGCSSELAL